MDSSYHPARMPSGAAEHVCRTLGALQRSSPDGDRLSASAYQRILLYCGVRPDLPGWRHFLLGALTLLGLLALVCGIIFFIAWNWAAMPKMAKFALVEGWILALAIVVCWRWRQTLARMALLAVGLSFGGLLALYGQTYQTGADSWELFRAWALVLLPLALLGRQNGLWICTWAVANLAFQFYYANQALLLIGDNAWQRFPWSADGLLYAYLAAQLLCLILRESLAGAARRRQPASWLAKRWPSRLMAGYLLLTLTFWVAGTVLDWSSADNRLIIVPWALLLLIGYVFYRHRRPDLCMLTLGMASLMVVGGVVILQLLYFSWETEALLLIAWGVGHPMLICGLMALWLTLCGACLLRWRREMYPQQAPDIAPDEVGALLQALQQRQLLNARQAAAVANFDHSERLPWYLRFALTLGGWLAAMIILMLLVLVLYAVGLLGSLNGASLAFYSALLAVPAALWLRKPTIGQQQIGMAWAIAATYGFYLAIMLIGDDYAQPSIMLKMLCFLPVLAVMAWAMPNALYRLMAVCLGVFLLVQSLGYFSSRYLPSALAIGLTALLVALLLAGWLQQVIRNASRPATGDGAWRYGIPAGLMALCLAAIHHNLLSDIFGPSSGSTMLATMLGIGIAVGLIGSALAYTQRTAADAVPVYLPAALFCGVIALFSPGLGLGLLLLLTARYLGSRLLLATAGGYLLLYLSDWYYFLGISLLHKALLLMVSGVVLLLLAMWVKQWQAQGGNHAD